MKELIHSNETMQQLNNGNSLTNLPQTLYSRSGDSFMAEQRGDMAQPRIPTNPTSSSPEGIENAVPQKPQRPDKPNRSELTKSPHSPEEKEKMGKNAELLKKLSSDPIFQEEAKKSAQEEPEQEEVRKKRDEQKGVMAHAQLNTIDTIGILDPVLRRTALHFNRRLGKGLMTDQDINDTIKDFESRLDEPTIQNNERTLVGDAIDQLEIELMTRRESQRAQYEEREKYGSLYGERKLDSQERDVIKRGINTQEIDRLFNRMFDRVDSNPREEFGKAFGTPGQLEYEEFIRTLNDVVTDEDASEPDKDRARLLIRRYSEERKVREVTHDVNYAVLAGVGTEKLVGFIQGFDSSEADLAFSKKGVVSTFHFYEQALLKIKAENGGFLPEYEVIGYPKTGVIGRAEKLAREYLNASQVGSNMADWEKNRAISLARGMGIITGRHLEIAASSILPENRYVSLYAQDVIRDFAPFRHLIYKFNIGEERNRVFAFLLNRKNAPWTKEELLDFKHEKMLDVINGLMDDNEERFLSNLNPFQVGGILSRTGWRLGEDPESGGLGDYIKENPDNRNWIGTGIQIELSRGSLRSKKDLDGIEDPAERRKAIEAEQKIRASLRKVTNIQPLKLFYNLPDLQKKVLNGRNLKEDIQLQDDLDKLVILQENAFNNKEDHLEFGTDEQGIRLEAFAKSVKDNFNEDQFVENLRDREWKLPFNIGTEDVPFDKYVFAKAGGSAIARRWRDIASAKKAVDGTVRLIKGMDSFKSPADIVPVIREIYEGVAGYDEALARRVTMKIAEGVTRFYSKDFLSRMPFGIGTLVSLVNKGSSFAEVAFGKGQMAWDELAVNEFSRLLRDPGLITEDQQHKLQGRVGGNKIAVIAAYARTIMPLIGLAVAFYILKETFEKKQ